MSDSEHEPTDVSAPDPDNDAPAESIEQQPKRSNVVAWLAAFMSLAALAIVALQEFNDWRTVAPSEPADYSSAIDDVREELARSDTALRALDAKIAAAQPQDYSGDIDVLRNDVTRQLQLLSSMPTRMGTLENSVASLAGISTGARETFLLAEAEYYLQIANAQLQLSGNPTLAALALKMADERVTQVSDPALIDVRRAIANELLSLDVMEQPDLVGTTLTLASLSSAVASLPLASDEATTEESVNDETASEGNAARAWRSVTEAFGSLVKVTPPDQAKLRLVSPNAEFFLRNNIAMQLQAARLALLRGEHALFHQTLDESDALLETYFDPASEKVVTARETISDIQGLVFSASPPDISGSLHLLRQFKTLRETAE